MREKGFLRTKGRNIVDAKGNPQTLHGVNFGGWLMMEAYFMHSPNHPVKQFKDDFRRKFGPAALKKFEKTFRDSFIREEDFRNVRKHGFNVLRIPFHHRLVEKAAYTYDKKGVAYLDRAVRWAGKHRLKVILDLHAASGCQNHDWHSDSNGAADLWKSAAHRKRTYALWEFLADRYKDEDAVAGYDLLNEAVLKDTRMLNRFYRELIRVIRGVDKNHILFVEGNNWAQDLDCLDEIRDDNYVLSGHYYMPLDFTFNFVPHLRYPFNTKQRRWNRAVTKSVLKKFDDVSRRRGCPIFIGEFGVNFRDAVYGEEKWLEDTLRCFRQFGFHWTYWTYKAVKNSAYPDGIYSYYENPPWVHREGPLTGWETYHLHWKKDKRKMARSWRTDVFGLNTPVLKTLQTYA